MNTQKREFGTFIEVDSEIQSSGNYKWKFFYIDISSNPQYPESACFKLENDKLHLADNLKKGQSVMVDFRIKGRFYQKDEHTPKKHFQNLVAWQIGVMQSSTILPQEPDPVPQPAPVTPVPVQTKVDFGKSVETPLEGDLPEFVKTKDTDDPF